jgi:hypothetical protein
MVPEVDGDAAESLGKPPFVDFYPITISSLYIKQ